MTCLLPGKMWFQESFNYTTNVSVSKTLLCEFIQLIPTSLIITKLKCLPNTKTLAKFFKYILLCNKSELLSSVQVFFFFFLELILLKSSCKATGCIHMLQIRQRKFKTISKWCVSFIPFLLFSFLFFFSSPEISFCYFNIEGINR